MVALLAAATAATVSFVFLSVVVFAVISFITKHRSLAVLKQLPGPKPNILFGNALWLTGESDANMQQVLDWIEEYNPEGIFCVWLGPTYPLVLIYKPDLCETLLSSSKHITKAPDYEFLHPWLGTGKR